MTEKLELVEYNFWKDSWIQSILDSIQYSKGLKRIAEIFARLIAITFISWFIGLIPVFIIYGLFDVELNHWYFMGAGFIIFMLFDLFKFYREKRKLK